MERESWHLRKELSIGTIVSLIVLGTGALAGYLDTKAVAQTNAKTLQGMEAVPERITRLEERLLKLQEQQVELKRDIAVARTDNVQQTQAMLKALQEIQVAIARIQTEITINGQ